MFRSCNSNREIRQRIHSLAYKNLHKTVQSVIKNYLSHLQKGGSLFVSIQQLRNCITDNFKTMNVINESLLTQIQNSFTSSKINVELKNDGLVIKLKDDCVITKYP